MLNVCLIGDMKFRISVASEGQGLSEKVATKLICKLEETAVVEVFNHTYLWNGL